MRHCASAKAVSKSGRVLFAFSRFYLPFYGRDIRFLFDHYYLFGWISAFIYDIDEQIEVNQDISESLACLDDLQNYLTPYVAIDAPIMQLFRDAKLYYRFEHEISHHAAAYSLTDLCEMNQLRSFDFRLMHRVLSQLLASPYREELFTWFRWFEILMEIEDDLCSLSEDYQRNTFNIVNLASRCSPEEALVLAGRIHLKVESELRHAIEALPDADRRACIHVIKSYREIVQRPELPLS